MKIGLRIRNIVSPNVDFDVWRPDSLEDVYFPLEMEIGPVGKDMADVFGVIVATPEGLRRFAKRGIISERGLLKEVISERGLLVLSEFSWEVVHKTLDRILEAGAGETWNESVLRLQRYLRWEYEDYTAE
jgi:hypothetical protein